MHARFEHAYPGEQAEQEIKRGLAHIEQVQGREPGDPHACERERDERKRVGIEDGDDDDGHQVVDDGERQQERPEGGRDRASQEGADADREADIRGRRDRPAAQRLGAGAVQRHIDDGRNHEAPDRRDHRQRRLAPAGERALAGLPLDLQTDEQEEDRHQAVVDPMLQRLGEADRTDPDLAGQMQERGVIGLERRIGDHQGGKRREGESHASVQIGTIARMRRRRHVEFSRHVRLSHQLCLRSTLVKSKVRTPSSVWGRCRTSGWLKVATASA
jgi:hypothetical protein